MKTFQTIEQTAVKHAAKGDRQRLVVDAAPLKAGRLTREEFARAGRNKADRGKSAAEEFARWQRENAQ